MNKLTLPQNPSLNGFTAIAFDFDGTLVDTMDLHYEAYRRVFDRIDLELTKADFLSKIGGKASETIPAFLGGRPSHLSVAEIHALKKQEFRIILENFPIKILPTARLLPMLFPIIPLALVSSGSREGIDKILKQLGWGDYFKVIVTGEDTARGKPDPMPYLLAAERLGLKPCGMAAIEDTEAGMDSARRAGMHAISVADSSPSTST